MALGAHGAVLGTRLVATTESEAAEGFKRLIVKTEDGGANTVRTRLYDRLRGTGGWPGEYNGRVLINDTWKEHVAGVDEETLRGRYEEGVGRGDWGRATAFA